MWYFIIGAFFGIWALLYMNTAYPGKYDLVVNMIGFLVVFFGWPFIITYMIAEWATQ